MRIRHLALAGSLAVASAAHAADIESITRLAFGPDNTIFVADWKAARVHALVLPAAAAVPAGATFNILDLEALASKAVGGARVTVEDMAVRPGTGEVYVAVSYGAAKVPALLVVSHDQHVRRVDLAKTRSTSIALKSPNTSDFTFWKDAPERSFTVTDMKWRQGELFVAGLSNQDFASSLRRIAYPFTGKQGLTSIEMYHTTHNQIETRAPIRTMTFADFGGKSYLVAAYTCTPIVTIPLDDIKDGVHVHGKVIAELGYGNTPADMITYTRTSEGKSEDVVLLLNYERVPNLIPVSQIEAAQARPEIDKPVPFGMITGLEPFQTPLAGAVRVDSLDDKAIIVVRRQLEKGKLELVTVDKMMGFRLSDHISEYNFKQYSYSGKEYQLKYLKPVQDMLMRQEGYPDLIKAE
jgi:hypothetical protein